METLQLVGHHLRKGRLKSLAVGLEPVSTV